MMALGATQILCVRRNGRFDCVSYPFGQILACGPLCATCIDNILEHARSWGGDYSEFEERVQLKLQREGLGN
jgi:hypothetical protein